MIAETYSVVGGVRRRRGGREQPLPSRALRGRQGGHRPRTSCAYHLKYSALELASSQSSLFLSGIYSAELRCHGRRLALQLCRSETALANRAASASL